MLAVAFPCALGAQLRAIEPGLRIRINAPSLGGVLTGTLMAQRPDSLDIVTSRLKRQMIATSDIRALAVGTGDRRSLGWTGGLVGSVGVLAAGVAEHAKLNDGILGGAIVGAFSGMLVGGFLSRERWTKVFP